MQRERRRERERLVLLARNSLTIKERSNCPPTFSVWKDFPTTFIILIFMTVETSIKISVDKMIYLRISLSSTLKNKKPSRERKEVAVAGGVDCSLRKKVYLIYHPRVRKTEQGVALFRKTNKRQYQNNQATTKKSRQPPPPPVRTHTHTHTHTHTI